MALDSAFARLKADIGSPAVNMAPLIDMVFLLLIFYVVTTTFNRETGIPVDKARADSAVMLDRHRALVVIDGKGTYWIDDREYALTAAVERVRQLRQADPEAPVIILPDRNGTVDPMIKLLDRLRSAGITGFAIGAEKGHGD